MKYTTEQIEAIAAKLRNMPAVEKKKRDGRTRQEVCGVLTKEIAILRESGYTLDQIANSLRGEGEDIATPILKSYMERVKPVKAQAASGGLRHKGENDGK